MSTKIKFYIFAHFSEKYPKNKAKLDVHCLAPHAVGTVLNHL